MHTEHEIDAPSWNETLASQAVSSSPSGQVLSDQDAVVSHLGETTRRTNQSERIEICRPYVFGDEIEMIAKVLWSGQHCGDGPFTRMCHKLLEEELKCERVLLTTSCTSALEMSAMLLELQRGDEVIMPSFTFVSTANAFTNLGARPVFCDVRSDTLNIDESSIEALVTSRTRAIVVVHYAGVACDMTAVGEIAKRHNLVVILPWPSSWDVRSVWSGEFPPNQKLLVR